LLKQYNNAKSVATPFFARISRASATVDFQTLGHRRQGGVIGVPWYLWLKHQTPIVPLDQWTFADGLWTLARRRFAAVDVATEMRFGTSPPWTLGSYAGSTWCPNTNA
jgi:hypothetical protein